MPGPLIRAAGRRDAMDLVAFIDMASEGFASWFWSTIAAPGQSRIEIGRSRALRDEATFSWRNARIAEIDGTPAGGLVGYPFGEGPTADEIAAMPPFLKQIAALEALVPHHWYVNVLAVHPEFRGQGVGRALLRDADRLAAATPTRGMAIIVADENVPALRLYEAVGYRILDRRTLVPYPGYERTGDWMLLTKPRG
ncbi:MAG: GNAT family N-acetyltransferase [Bauldia sp.]|nr:GNAT family N-acetyltransferase [Bauldia sp.]